MSAADIVAPMDTARAVELPRREGWSFEPEQDGIRILANVAGGSMALLSRGSAGASPASDDEAWVIDDPQHARRQHLLELLTPPVSRVLRAVDLLR